MPADMNGSLDCTESLVSRFPVTVRRRVEWGECDPAQIVYTPRFSDYLVAAARWFFRTAFASQGISLEDLGVSTPMKAMNLVFAGTLKPDDWFEMTVTVSEIRTRTFDLHVDGRGIDGSDRFSGLMTPICVDKNTFKGVPIPGVVRAQLELYRAAKSKLSS